MLETMQDQLSRAAEAYDLDGEMTFRPMFGGICAYIGGRVFASLSDVGLALKLAPGSQQRCWPGPARSASNMSRTRHLPNSTSSCRRTWPTSRRNWPLGSGAAWITSRPCPLQSRNRPSHREQGFSTDRRRGDTDGMAQTGLIKKHRLSVDDITQIQTLEAACDQADGIRVKWDLDPDRDPARVRDFCWYEAGCIVGSVQLDGFGEEFEVTGAVLPTYRGRGIFRRLFEAARTEAQNREARQLLLISYPQNPLGTRIARRLGTTYRFSEYHMVAEAASVPPLPQSELRLTEVTPDDDSELAWTMSLCFGGGRWQEPGELRRALEQPGQRFFLAKLGQETVGQIGAVVCRKAKHTCGLSAFCRNDGVRDGGSRCWPHQSIS